MELSPERTALLWLSAAEVPLQRLEEPIAAHGVQSLWQDYQVLSSRLFSPGERKVLTPLHSPDAMNAFYDSVKKKGIHVLFSDDPLFPENLKNIPDPPAVLYYAGQTRAFLPKAVAVVGSRRSTGYGREMAQSIARDMAEAGVAVVSGLAAGIDTAAHLGALEGGGVTIGVMGSGLDNPYPAENRKLMRDIASTNGIVISEYPPGSGPVKYHFPHRNRLIAGLSLGVVFVEGSMKSGALHTVDAALAQGKDVFALPGQVGHIGSEGPHKIIREGASLITCGADVLEELGLAGLEQHKENRPPWEGLAGIEGQIVRQLARESMTAGDLSRALGVDEGELILTLGMLEIDGSVVREAGNHFRLPKH